MFWYQIVKYTIYEEANISDNEDKFKSWMPPENGTDQPDNNIRWTALSAGTWLRLVALHIAKIVLAFAWGVSFQTVNPIMQGIFLADFLPFPLPVELQNLSASILINITLGILAVTLPSVLWEYALKYDVLRNPRDYFMGNPLRIFVCSLLISTYGLTISLEIMALMNRANANINAGPIPVLGVQAEFVPLAIASAALVLGSCLLGLASAKLSLSISNRYSVHS